MYNSETSGSIDSITRVNMGDLNVTYVDDVYANEYQQNAISNNNNNKKKRNTNHIELETIVQKRDGNDGDIGDSVYISLFIQSEFEENKLN